MAFNRIADTNLAGYPTAGLTCQICLDGFENDDHILTHDGEGTPHAFHYPCSQFWLAAHDTCPVCRLKITHINGQSLQTLREEWSLDNTQPAEELYNAAIDGNLARVLQLLNGEFTTDELVEAAWLAVENGHLDIANAIIDNADTPEDVRGATLSLVIRGGRANDLNRRVRDEDAVLNDVNALLAGGEISQSTRGIAIGVAISHQFVNITNALLISGEITQNFREAAIVLASGIGNLNALNMLLDSGEISQETVRIAIISALVPDLHLDVIGVLVSLVPVSTEIRDAMLYFARNKQMDLYHALCNAPDVE